MTEPTSKKAAKAAKAAKPRSRLRRAVRMLVRLTIWVVGLFVFVFGGAWLWFESSSSGPVIAQKTEAFLEDGLQRDVSIGRISLRPGLPAKIVIADVRLGNVEGSERETQAAIEKIELKLSLRALIERKVRIRDVVLVAPSFVLEVYEDESGITTNLPKWHRETSTTKPPDIRVGTITIRDGSFELYDHAHGLSVVARGIGGELEPDLKVVANPRAHGRIGVEAVHFVVRTIEFPVFAAETGIRFEERVLWVDEFTAKSNAVTASASGPIRANRLDLEATLTASLGDLREPLGLEQELEGSVEARATIGGYYEDVQVVGTFKSPNALFDVYGVTAIEGSFGTIENGFEVAADTGRFAGGTISARYAALSREGEPANVLEIGHEGISVESLLGVWNLHDTGILARGRGQLQMKWDSGSPAEGLSGSAVLTVDAGRRTRAKYGTPVSGQVAYSMSGGDLRFDQISLQSDTTKIDVEGTIGLEDSKLDLRADVVSSSFVDVDRLWLDLARAFGQETWVLLDVVGNGTIKAAVGGAMDQPIVDLLVNADGFHYAGLKLERADGRLVFDGSRNDLFFDNVRFESGLGEITIRDRIDLSGDEIGLALRVGLHDWEVEPILEFLGLSFPVGGFATGTVAVSGRPSAGRASFSPLDILDETSSIKLFGDVSWTEEEKGISFDLDVGLIDVPIETVAGVLDLGEDLPLSGNTTGTVHLEGPLTDVSGAGSVTIRSGRLLGEPVDQIASDLVLSAGVFRLRNLDIRMPAGYIRGEAKVDFAEDRFGYVINASEIDIEKLEGYPRVRNVLTGKLIVESSGAGSLEDPEIVLDIRVKDAVLLEVPVTEPGVELYFALRDGTFATRGSVGQALELDGAGEFDAASGVIEGEMSVSIGHIADVTRQLEKRTGVSTRGRADLTLAFSGAISPLDQLVVEGRIESIDLQLAEHTVRTSEPSRFIMRAGRFEIESFELLVNDQTFAAGGTISLDDGSLDMRMNGLIEAGLLAVAMPDLRASGDVQVALRIGGTIDDPAVDGTAEIRNADFRIVGFPQALRGVQSTLVLSDELIEIDSFTARLGGGSVSAGGRIELREGSPRRIRINSQGRQVDLRLSQGLTVAGDFDLILAGDPLDRMFLQGEARLERVLYTKDLELGAAIVDFIVSRRAKIEAVEQEWQTRVGLDVDVDARDAIRVRNNMARVTGSAEVAVSGTLAQPVLSGAAVIDEGGMLRISEVEYRVVNGSVTFQNPFRIDPYIDLTAEGRYRNEYDLTVIVTGTPDALQMAVSSDPPIADLSILNVFGVENDSATGSVNTRNAVSSAGGSIIDSSVGSLVGSRLAFADNLRLEGLTGPEPKVTIEKSISDEVRAIVTYTMNDAGDNIEIIEWRASPRFMIQATRDSTKDNTYLINAVDVTFSSRFGGQWCIGGSRGWPFSSR